MTVPTPTSPPTDGADLLREHGVQVTAQRLAVMRAVESQAHVPADEVHELVRNELGAISRQAVYDSLTVLAEKGILRRIQHAGSPALYEGRAGDNHHHLVCRVCGLVVDVDCAVGDTPCLTAADDAGFEIDEAEVVFWGRCPVCQANPEQAVGRQRNRRPSQDHQPSNHRSTPIPEET